MLDTRRHAISRLIRPTCSLTPRRAPPALDEKINMPTYQYLTSDNQAEDGIATSTMTRIPSDSVYYAIKSCVRTRTDERTSVKTIRLYCRSQGIGYYKLPKYLSSIEPRFPCPFLTNQIPVLRIGQRPKRLKLPKHATKYLQVHSDSESDN